MKTQELHLRALSLAETYRTSEASLLVVLMEMQEGRCFLSLGFTGLFDYCTRGLGLSEVQAQYFKRVAIKAIEVPALKEAVVSGKITLSKARRIEPVVNVANCESWVDKCEVLPQRELERAVAAVNPNALVTEKIRPVSSDRSELRVGISVEFEKKLERVKALLGKNAEAVLERAVRELLERIDPEKKAERARKPKPVPAKSASLGSRTPISAAVKHQVVEVHGYRCRECQTERYLHFHHKKPVAQGGENSPENLELLCSAHHRMHHRNGSHHPKAQSDRPRR